MNIYPEDGIERVCHLLCEPVVVDWSSEQTRCKPLVQQLIESDPKSLDFARKWFRKAADVGCARAMRYLAWMLRRGRGGPKDKNQARRLFTYIIHTRICIYIYIYSFSNLRFFQLWYTH